MYIPGIIVVFVVRSSQSLNPTLTANTQCAGLSVPVRSQPPPFVLAGLDVNATEQNNFRKTTTGNGIQKYQKPLTNLLPNQHVCTTSTPPPPSFYRCQRLQNRTAKGNAVALVTVMTFLLTGQMPPTNERMSVPPATKPAKRPRTIPPPPPSTPPGPPNPPSTPPLARSSASLVSPSKIFPNEIASDSNNGGKEGGLPTPPFHHTTRPPVLWFSLKCHVLPCSGTTSYSVQPPPFPNTPPILRLVWGRHVIRVGLQQSCASVATSASSLLLHSDGGCGHQEDSHLKRLV